MFTMDKLFLVYNLKGHLIMGSIMAIVTKPGRQARFSNSIFIFTQLPLSLLYIGNFSPPPPPILPFFSSSLMTVLPVLFVNQRFVFIFFLLLQLLEAALPLA